MKKDSILTIINLHASVENTAILRGVSIQIKSGETHVVMGPNGSGKSTFASVLLGHPSYTILPRKDTVIRINSINLIPLSTDQRAKLGIYYGFQSPIAISGVTVMNLLRVAYQRLHPGIQKAQKTIQNPALSRMWRGDIPIDRFMELVKKTTHTLKLDESLLYRGIHDGLSGGEKKKVEMLMATVLKPKFAIFDEIDTGLDVDALKIVGTAVKALTLTGTGLLIITHYRRILRYVPPTHVHIFIGGKIIQSGGPELAKKVEKNGYEGFLNSDP